jgi:hypothetical protein
MLILQAIIAVYAIGTSYNLPNTERTRNVPGNFLDTARRD